jgi:hypothetical protein
MRNNILISDAQAKLTPDTVLANLKAGNSNLYD